LEALIDSPWARDACNDVAHGYLTAKLAHPDLKTSQFCTLYSKDISQMHDDDVKKAITAKSDKAELKRKQADKLKRKTAEATAALAAKAKKEAEAQKIKEEEARAAQVEAAEILAAKMRAAEEKKKEDEIKQAQSSSSGFLHDAALANIKNAGAVDFELDHPQAGAASSSGDLWSQFLGTKVAPSSVVEKAEQEKPVAPSSVVEIAEEEKPVVAAVAKPPLPPAPKVAEKKDVVVPKAAVKAEPKAAAKKTEAKKAAPKKVASLAVAKAPVTIAAPKKDDADAEGDGAAFWGEMFQG